MKSFSSSAELATLNGTLTARLEACGHVLAEYEALGQPPPVGFRAWPLAQLRARHADLSERREELREVAPRPAPRPAHHPCAPPAAP